LIRAAGALKLDDVYVVPGCAALHVQALSAVHIHQFEIVVGTAGIPPLIRSAIPWKLLNVGAIAAIISGNIHYQAAIDIANRELPTAQINKFPTLIPSAITGILLDVGVFTGAAAEYIDAFSGIDIAEKSTVPGLPLDLHLSASLGRRDNQN